jgi:hypothetical protein
VVHETIIFWRIHKGLFPLGWSYVIFFVLPLDRNIGPSRKTFFIDEKGYVGRQDFWQGNPYKILGFNKTPKTGDISLMFEDFKKDPKQAEGMYPVFSTAQDEWTTHQDPIAEVEILKN